jgi:hypothetical protein
MVDDVVVVGVAVPGRKFMVFFCMSGAAVVEEAPCGGCIPG